MRHSYFRTDRGDCMSQAAVIEVEGASKAKRTAVHAFFRRSGMPRVETESVTKDGKQARSGPGLAAVHSITVSYQGAVSACQSLCSTCRHWCDSQCS